MDPADVTLDTFVPLVGSVFTVPVDGDHDDLPLTLATATPLPRGPEHGFTLEFVGPTDAVLEQGTYRLVHADLGTMPMFLVPVAEDAAGRHYEAVFTRLPQAPTA